MTSLSRLCSALSILLALPVVAQTLTSPAEAPVAPGGPAASVLTSGEVSLRRLTPNYPTPNEPATPEQIKAVLDRVLGYLEVASPVRVVNRETMAPVGDLAHLPLQVGLDTGDFRIVSYEWGVTYSGMLLAAEVTGEARYRDYVARRMEVIAALAAHVRTTGAAAWPQDPQQRRFFQLRGVVEPRSLDDSGAMCAAMLKAHRAGVQPEALRPWIDNFVDYISNRQLRLADGTLARNRPFANSLWLDDLYMSVPALAQAGKLTGERKYFDDAVRQVVQFSARMFNRERGLYLHGWVEGMAVHPEFRWARANGWALMAMTELLEVLPEDHPGRGAVLELLRAHIRGLAECQGDDGRWHQLLDRPASYRETSATAIFTYCIAHAINRGWIDAAAHGPMVSLAWNAVAQNVNDKGQVENTCVGTGMGWDPMFYCSRPTSVFAAHGYGPVLLAGAEMIALRRGRGAELGLRDGGVHLGHGLEAR